MILKILKGKGGILAPDLHVAADVVLKVFLIIAGKHILGVGGQGVQGHMGDHVADHKVRIDLVAFRNRDGACHKLIVESLKGGLGI